MRMYLVVAALLAVPLAAQPPRDLPRRYTGPPEPHPDPPSPRGTLVWAADINRVERALRPGGVVLVATFAEDGADRCSGLPVARYGAQALHGTFGPQFELVEAHREVHTTPGGAAQAFTYGAFRYRPRDGSGVAASQHVAHVVGVGGWRSRPRVHSP